MCLQVSKSSLLLVPMEKAQAHQQGVVIGASSLLFVQTAMDLKCRHMVYMMYMMYIQFCRPTVSNPCIVRSIFPHIRPSFSHQYLLGFGTLAL